MGQEEEQGGGTSNIPMVGARCLYSACRSAYHSLFFDLIPTVEGRRARLVALLEDGSNPDTEVLLPLVMQILARQEPDPMSLLGDLTGLPPIELPIIEEGEPPPLYLAVHNLEIHPDIPEAGCKSEVLVPIDRGTIVPIIGAKDTAPAKGKKGKKQNKKKEAFKFFDSPPSPLNMAIPACPVPRETFGDKHPLAVGTRVDCRYPGGRYYGAVVAYVNPADTNGAFDDERNKGTWRKDHPGGGGGPACLSLLRRVCVSCLVV